MTTKHTEILREALERLQSLGQWLILVFPGLSSRASSMAAAERLFGVRAVRVRHENDTSLT
jgi:hypothetical protein